jgi:hypothetical protein
MLRFHPMMTSFLDLIIAAVGSTGLTSAAVFGIVKFLLKPLWNTLNGYAIAYSQQKAAIDARIANLERLVEEQARLTRTVETIKDEIATQAKSRDNQWVFRKDVYVTLLKEIEEILSLAAQVNNCLLNNQSVPAALSEPTYLAIKRFSAAAALAPLATAITVLPIISETLKMLPTPPITVDTAQSVKTIVQTFIKLRTELQQAGRRDLWGDSETVAIQQSA